MTTRDPRDPGPMAVGGQIEPIHGQVMDEMEDRLTGKGLVPRTTSIAGNTSWEHPYREHLNWPEVILLIAVLTFILLLIWGAPW